MDRLVFIAAISASELTQSQAISANNLANITTPGFRASFAQQRSMPLYGDGEPTRTYSVTATPGQSFSLGPMKQTGNSLDVAIKSEDGFFAVQDTKGIEAYTKRGDLHINANNLLENGAGQLILSQSGPISIPAHKNIAINESGEVIITPLGDNAKELVINQIKAVTLDLNNIYMQEDGTFKRKDGAVAEADPMIDFNSMVVEGSNVNAIGELVKFLTDTREFELSIKMIKSAEENDQASNKLIRVA